MFKRNNIFTVSDEMKKYIKENTHKSMEKYLKKNISVKPVLNPLLIDPNNSNLFLISLVSFISFLAGYHYKRITST